MHNSFSLCGNNDCRKVMGNAKVKSVPEKVQDFASFLSSLFSSINVIEQFVSFL